MKKEQLTQDELGSLAVALNAKIRELEDALIEADRANYKDLQKEYAENLLEITRKSLSNVQV